MRLRTAVLGVLAAASLACGVALAAEVRAGEDVEVTGSYDELVFAAGDSVRIAATATDDVAAAGGDIAVDGATLDHVFLAGGDISLTNSAVRDVFAAGGEIDLLSGQIADDVVAAGGRIKLGSELRVDGDVVVAGGELRIDAPVGGDVRASGGRIYLSGTVNGDVFLDGGTIEIGPDVHILGSLTHRGRSVTIAPEAQVDGQITALRPRPEPDLRPLKAVATWAAAAIIFGMFLMAVVVAVSFPRLMNDTAESLRTRPLSMLGLGVLLALLTPVAIVVLIATLIGLPLAFLLGAAFALLWPIAIIGAVYAVGMLVRARTGKDGPPTAGARALWAGLAMIVFILLGLVPVFGFFLWLVTYFFGLGAATFAAARALSRTHAQPAAA